MFEDWAHQVVVRRLAEASGHLFIRSTMICSRNYVEDSLDFVELMTGLEEDFGLGEVTDGSLRTVCDLVELVRRSGR